MFPKTKNFSWNFPCVQIVTDISFCHSFLDPANGPSQDTIMDAKLKKNKYYVNINKGIESYNDMRLMSMCRHHIIANSTFSWWGAYLNKNENKKVIFPEFWFTPNWDNLDTSDIVKPEWIKL